MSFKIKGSAEVSGKLKLNPEAINRALTVDANGELTSSDVTSTELSQLSGVTGPVQTQLSNNATDISDHISDAADAHDASAISNIPSGNLAATDVQGALNELQSDIDTRALDVDVIKKDGSVAFTGDQSMGGNQLTNVGAPIASSDAATKQYVDNVAEGLKPKTAARVASTANLTLANEQTIDGISAVAGDRVLVKDQTDAEDNGIYIVVDAGAWTRSTDFDSLTPIDEVNGAMVAVQEGTANAGKVYVQSGLVTTLGTDPINFIFFNSSASLVGGDGITVSGSNISVDHDGEGLTFVATQLALELDGSTLTKSSSGLKLSDTAVTPATLGSASETITLTVDQQGRLTAASEQAIAILASQVTDFDEAAQDSIGTILVDSSSIDFTYDDGVPSITATVLPAGVDHDQLLNFVANEHIDHSAVQIATAADSGLTGGGDITATRNLSVDINGTTAETSASNLDKILIYDASATALKSMTRGNFLAGIPTGSAGDINETSFSLANNQASPANVTGFLFAPATVRSFEALVSVEIDATAELYEVFTLRGIQKNGSFDMSITANGDESGIVFSITSGGQVQYISQDNAGFVSGLIKFRAISTTV